MTRRPRAAYRRLLRTKEWREFREHVLSMDGYTCKRCGRTDEEAALHVHHVRYEDGRLPWKYAYSAMETLCAGCHAREHGIIPPADGWTLVATDDLGDISGECEYCGTPIRHVFSVDHPGWEMMDVGTVCCDYLTGTTAATDAVKALDRRERFIKSPRWRDRRGGVCTITQCGIDVATVCTGRGFIVKMNGIRGARTYPTAGDARQAAFDAINTGKALAFLSRIAP